MFVSHCFSHGSVCLFLSAEVIDLEDCAQVLRGVASSPACPAQYGLTLLSVVRHLARLCLHGSRNQLNPRNLAETFGPLLFRHSTGSVINQHIQRKTGAVLYIYLLVVLYIFPFSV